MWLPGFILWAAGALAWACGPSEASPTSFDAESPVYVNCHLSRRENGVASVRRVAFAVTANQAVNVPIDFFGEPFSLGTYIRHQDEGGLKMGWLSLSRDTDVEVVSAIGSGESAGIFRSRKNPDGSKLSYSADCFAAWKAQKPYELIHFESPK